MTATLLPRETGRFLQALTGERDPVVTFQVFPDPETLKGEEKGLHLTGPLSLNYKGLAADNLRDKMGIFAVINAGGRKQESITKLRALFVDDDCGTLDTASLALEPSIIVRSKRGAHVYWLLHPGEPLERFGVAQRHLAAALGTDPRMCNLDRVLRVPGFLHQKDPEASFLVRLEKCAPRLRYTIDEVLSAFPAPEGWAPPARETSVPAMPRPRARKRPLKQARRMLLALCKSDLYLWAFENPDDVSREVWRGLATNLAAAAGGNEEALGIAEELFLRLSKPYFGFRESETRATFRGAVRSVESHGPMTYATLADAGAPEDTMRKGLINGYRAPVALAKGEMR